jgi:hypothetical protein
MNHHFKQFLVAMILTLSHLFAAEQLDVNESTHQPSYSSHPIWTNQDVLDIVAEFVPADDVNSYAPSFRNALFSVNNSLHSKLYQHAELRRLFEKSSSFIHRTLVITPDMLILQLFSDLTHSTELSSSSILLLHIPLELLNALNLSTMSHTFKQLAELSPDALKKKPSQEMEKLNYGLRKDMLKGSMALLKIQMSFYGLQT